MITMAIKALKLIGIVYICEYSIYIVTNFILLTAACNAHCTFGSPPVASPQLCNNRREPRLCARYSYIQPYDISYLGIFGCKSTNR